MVTEQSTQATHIMNMTSEVSSDLQIITILDSRIDAAAAIQFKDRFKEVTAEMNCPVVLDLSNVEFVDSSGLGAIVSSMKYLGNARPLHLASLTPIVGKVFSLTRMDRVFKIYDSSKDAIQINGAKSA